MVFVIMPKPNEENQSILRQTANFVIHLRWHYQVFILSGGYLAGGFLSASVDWNVFLIQYCNVHLLLFGGATAYNSYWDRDEGPVGGLKHPPKMNRWMWPASMLVQLIGLGIACQGGLLFASVYLLSLVLFWLYSSPLTRWKGKPLLSLLAIGISTGANALLMGYVAAGNATLPLLILTAAAGTALMILSFYPTSQLYQIDEDRRRGDKTFAITFGFIGVIYFYRTAFAGGALLLGIAVMQQAGGIGIGFLAVCVAAGFWGDQQIKTMAVETENYQRVMRLKYAASLAFVIFFGILLLFRRYM